MRNTAMRNMVLLKLKRSRARRGASEWTPIYLLLVMIIAAILVITLVKPLFRQAAEQSRETLEEAETIARTASLLARLVF